MAHIVKKHIAAGITWIAIREADVYVCCGCPADTVKHLKKAGVIHEMQQDGISYESGPNCILLSDTLFQNGQIANLAEFPVLQMLYMQGTNLPGHFNYRKFDPMLIGRADQVESQINYISIGNHGLSTEKEIIETGTPVELSRKIFATKVFFSGGGVTPVKDLVIPCILEDGQVEIKNGVFISRTEVNEFSISYKDETVSVDLKLPENKHYTVPYLLPYCHSNPEVFSVTHSGEGNGWDINRPCMASIIRHRERIYLMDAGPNILNNLAYLGIGVSEIDGIFLSHIHDDHFAGITELLRTERKLDLYATSLIRDTAERKLRALLNSETDLLQMSFNCVDLEPDEWNNVHGMEIKPFYSPHTVETNVFHFRVLEGEEYKTYAHLSDAINLKTYQRIMDASPDIFSGADMDYVQEVYLSKMNLKKIDVGGGLIHGHLQDYADDASDLMVMAHTEIRPVSERGNIINVNFGETHVLIHHEGFSIWEKKAIGFLQVYFPMLEEKHLASLASLMDIRHFTPGEMLPKPMDSGGKSFLILSGLVETENRPAAEALDAGNIVGPINKYFGHDGHETYSARSHVTCLEMDEKSMDRLIHDFKLAEALDFRRGITRMLLKCDLLQCLVSNAVVTKLSNVSEKVVVAENGLSEETLENYLYILLNGIVKARYFHGKQLQIHPYGYFGGEGIWQKSGQSPIYKIESDIKALSIPISQIMQIPKLLGMMTELEEKRQQSIFFKNK